MRNFVQFVELQILAEKAAESALRKYFKSKECHRTVTLSTATQSNLRDLFHNVGFRRVLYAGPPVEPGQHFDPFQWDGRSEDAGALDARNHIEAQLVKFGVRIGPDGFKVEDVHKNKMLLNVTDEKIGSISGGSDIVLLPFRTSVRGARESLSVLFELKTHDNVRNSSDGLVSFEPQAQLELLAARCVSDQPGVLVVLTDLVSAAILYYMEHSPDQQTFEVVERPATLHEMGALVAEFLASTAVPRSDYRPLVERNDPREAPCLQFKKTRLSHDAGLAWEHFQDMADDTEPNSEERAELVRQLFRSMDVPMPSILHESMYV